MLHHLTCLTCASVNRVPGDRLSANPRCGTCGAGILDGTVKPLDPATLAKAVKKDTLPLLVDFWAPCCGPCRMMAPEFAKAALEIHPHARFAKINTEEHPAVSRKFGIRGIPLLILFRNGREVARLPGARPAAGIAEFVRGHAGLPA